MKVFNVEGIKRRRGFTRVRALAKAAKSTVGGDTVPALH